MYTGAEGPLELPLTPPPPPPPPPPHVANVDWTKNMASSATATARASCTFMETTSEVKESEPPAVAGGLTENPNHLISWFTALAGSTARYRRRF
jgi:hypothetical protein